MCDRKLANILFLDRSTHNDFIVSAAVITGYIACTLEEGISLFFITRGV